MNNTLVVDCATGLFRIMTGHFRNDGGGRAKFSFSVGFVAANAAQVANRKNALTFPFNVRQTLTFWNLVNLPARRGPRTLLGPLAGIAGNILSTRWPIAANVIHRAI